MVAVPVVIAAPVVTLKDMRHLAAAGQLIGVVVTAFACTLKEIQSVLVLVGRFHGLRNQTAEIGANF